MSASKLGGPAGEPVVPRSPRRVLAHVIGVHAPWLGRLLLDLGMRYLPLSAIRALGTRLFHAGDAALNRGDVEAGLCFFSPDLDAHVPEPMPDAGPVRGHDAGVQYWTGLLEAWRIAIRNDVIDASREGLVTRFIFRMTGRETGLRLEVRGTSTFTIRNGWITTYRLDVEDAKVEGERLSDARKDS